MKEKLFILICASMFCGIPTFADNLDNNTSVREFSVPESVTGYIINVDNPLSGVSQLNLVENGQVTENMKLKF